MIRDDLLSHVNMYLNCTVAVWDIICWSDWFVL